MRLLTMFITLLFVSILLFACTDSGDSDNFDGTGLDGGLYLDELSESQIETICQWQLPIVESLRDESACREGETDGDSEIDFEFETEDELIPIDQYYQTLDLDNCKTGPQFEQHCLLNDLEACYKESGNDNCDFEATEACQNLENCLDGEDAENPPSNFTICPPWSMICFCNVLNTDSTWTTMQVNPANNSIQACFNWSRMACLPCQSQAYYNRFCENDSSLSQYKAKNCQAVTQQR